VEGEKENEKGERESLKTFYAKIKLTIRAGRSVGSAVSKGISLLNAPASSIVGPVLDYDVLVSGGGVRVSDVTRGEGV